VSGGVDSVVMARLFALAGFPFVMAHMNFGLRGRESAEDAQFVADLAQELGVECIAEKGDVKGYRKRNGVSVQMAARDLRYEFFRRVMQERGIERWLRRIMQMTIWNIFLSICIEEIWMWHGGGYGRSRGM